MQQLKIESYASGLVSIHADGRQSGKRPRPSQGKFNRLTRVE